MLVGIAYWNEEYKEKPGEKFGAEGQLVKPAQGSPLAGNVTPPRSSTLGATYPQV
jgi:hypothetical protein